MSLSWLKFLGAALVLWAQPGLGDPPPPADDLDAELQVLVDELESNLTVPSCPVGELTDDPGLAGCLERTHQWDLAALRLDPREPAAAPVRPTAEPHGSPGTAPSRPTHEEN